MSMNQGNEAMDNATRQVVASQLGSLMIANAELAARNVALTKANAEHLQHIGILKAELARWQQDAAKPEEPVGPVDRPEDEMENLPANPYNGAH